jgi:hypothetical protein
MTALDVRLPVSSQQLLWCAKTSNAFSPRFVIFVTLRITGHIDTAALQAALNDVVARHEALRTIVVRDADPPYQLVRPPMPVPLEVRELAPHLSRQQAVAEQLAEAEAASLDVEHLPLLRAILTRFDSRDYLLSLVSHHSACDGWSMNLVVRELAACYAARTAERPLDRPDVPQYQDYIRWQRHNRTQPAAAANMAYWQRQLAGAGIFTLPTDRPIPAAYTAPYVQHPFVIDPDVTASVLRLVKAEPFTASMVMLAAFNVLAHRISGAFDPAISTMWAGRSEPQFKDTVGLFLNFLTMRTDLAGCRSFRDVLVRTRATCLQAYQHEALHQQVLEEIPSLAEPLASPSNAYLVFGYWDRSLASATGGPSSIGQAVSVIRKRTRVSETLPGGVTWGMGMTASGEVEAGVQFSPEIFDEQTVAGWVSDYCRILATAMGDLDREWQEL